MEQINSIIFWKNFKENNTIKSIADEFKCAICKVLLIEPYFLSCSHHYCIECKNQLFSKDQKICNICNEEVDQSMLDKKLMKKLKEIEIPCLNSNQCSWKSDITFFQNHCSECDFQFVNCDLNCGSSFPRNELLKHKQNTCKEREIKCEFCQISEKSKNYTNHLDKQCIEIPINCPKLCKTDDQITQIKKKDIQLHLQNCSNQTISCQICNQQLTRNQIENHIKQNIHSHIFQIYDEIKFLKKEKDDQNIQIFQNEQKINNLEERLKLLENQNYNQNIDILENKQNIKNIEETINQEINTKNQEISDLKIFIENINNSKEKQLEKLQQQINKLDPKINPPEKITLNHGSGVSGLLHFSEGLLISGGKRDIKYWNLNDYKLIHSIPNAHSNYIYSLRKLNEKQFISGSHDNSIKIWDVETKQTIKTFNEHTYTVMDLLVLSNKRIASASYDKLIKIWDVNSNNSIQTLTGHSDYVYSLIEMKDDEIISCSADKTIRFWDLNTSNNTKTIQAHSTDIYCLVKISNSQFASGSYDSTIKIWDYPNGDCVRILQGHTSYIIYLISVDSNIIASGSGDNSIKLWNVSTGGTLSTINAHTSQVNTLVKLNESDFASGSSEGDVIVWRNYKIESIRLYNKRYGFNYSQI